MAWIKMRTDLADDPAVIAIASKMDIQEDLVVGKLHRLWSWADRHTRDGRAAGLDSRWVDRFLGGPFSQHLVSVGWLSFDNDGLVIPRFEVHNGQSAKLRATNTVRQRSSRSTRDNCATEARQERDISVTEPLPDKRREEKSTDTHTHAAETVESPIIHRPRLSPELTPIFEAYPAHRRTGKMAALKAISRALDTLEARGESNPSGWLLARVEAFARSWQGQSSLCWKAARWFDDGHYDDPDSAWQESHDGNRGHGGGAAFGGEVGAGARGTGTYGRRTEGQYPEPPLYIPR